MFESDIEMHCGALGGCLRAPVGEPNDKSSATAAQHAINQRQVPG